MCAADRYLKIALDTLRGMELDPNLNAHHAAIIVSGGNILSIGVNKFKKNGFIKSFQHHDYCNTHAECDAVLRVRRKIDLTNAKIFVARLRRDGQVGNSKPCPMCENVLERYGIRRVFYTVDNKTHAVMKL